VIVGAGLAGLITAHALPREPILEAMSEPTEIHKALLRFRSTAVADLTGVEFKPVTVRKGIWSDGSYHAPSPRLANLYSTKVLGKALDRSIWNVDPVTRYIAPPDFYEQLINSVGHRITWGTAIGGADLAGPDPVVTTAPLPVVMKLLGWRIPELEFDRAPITVQRFRIEDCDIHQTVYFPDHSHPLYRASVTGDLLICEFVSGYDREIPHDWLTDTLDVFGLPAIDPPAPLDEIKQQYGKIAPIEEPTRRGLISQLTTKHNIYSVGRFATWRNILLDDVAHDAAMVKRLIHSGDYARTLAALPKELT